MIIFDTETTGLTKAGAIPLSQQPTIIEFAAIKLHDKTLKEKSRLDFLVNPKQQLEPIITKITGITDNDLTNEPTFGEKYSDLYDFFLGETIWVAHNIQFDFSLMKFDLQRIGKEFSFPYPKQYICTSEGTKHLNNGKRFKLNDLHKLATGKPIENAHRAINDVEALVACVKWLRKEHDFI